MTLLEMWGVKPVDLAVMTMLEIRQLVDRAETLIEEANRAHLAAEQRRSTHRGG